MDARIRDLERKAANGDAHAEERLGLLKCAVEGHCWNHWYTVWIYPHRRCIRCWQVWQRKDVRDNDRIYNLPEEQEAWQALIRSRATS